MEVNRREGIDVSPDVDHTPAGGSPPRPVPQVGDLVEVVKLPDQADKRLKIGQRGTVHSSTGAMYWVKLPWGIAALNAVQIELRG